MNKLFFYACSALLASGAALTAVSCADDDLDNGGTNGKDAVIRFSVNDVQEGAISRGVMTRGAITPGLGSSDLAGDKLTAHSNRNIDVCLIETTVEGVNPVKADAHTRANIIYTSTLGDFSVSAIRGTTETSILTTPEWFHAKKTKSDGELYSPIYWAFSQPWARFFAVYPNTESYSKMTIGNTETSGSPSVDFEVDSDVKNQKDFMAACTGDVHYATRGVHPPTNLDFRHALTGIRFAVGQNLSWNKTIDKVEIQNAVMKSKYILSSQFNGTGAAWDHSADTRGTATLSGVSVSTNHNPNITIMGNTGDNFTFYMIPQVLTGNNVKVNVHCTDGTVIDVVLKGEWKAGTTRTYKLSQTNSTWHYVLTPTNPSRAAKYNETTSQPYSIMSYREDPVTHTKQAVAWKVIGYSVDNGTTWTTTKPAWLTALSAESGDGGTAADQGTATLRKDITDRLAMYNKVLHDAAQKGSSSNPYDLSKHDFKGNDTQRNTANCYLISAPGYYKIPLVYGNAIKNGSNNTNSYQTANSGSYILQKFKDHAGANITSPYINVQNSGNPATQASIVWTDQSGIVEASSLSVTGSGQDSYLNFHVPADKIKNGNAVIAVKNAAGTIMWSWHLWFDHKDVLETVKCTNFQNKGYNFTKQTLGFAYLKWDGSTYDKNRIVKVKFEQTVGQKTPGKQHATITIEQEPGSVKEISSTLYQFGRKDAFPGTDTTPDGSFDKNGGDNMSIQNGIQHPETFYTRGSSWYNGYNQYNLWSMDNTTTGHNDNSVVKTIYDPCPAGFHMPASNAFTGFTTNGQNEGPMNVSGAWDYGWNFNNKISSPDATVYFPASGWRSYNDGSRNLVGDYGFYWSAVPYNPDLGCYLNFNSGGVRPLYAYYRSIGVPVRPVSE